MENYFVLDPLHVTTGSSGAELNLDDVAATFAELPGLGLAVESVLAEPFGLSEADMAAYLVGLNQGSVVFRFIVEKRKAAHLSPEALQAAHMRLRYGWLTKPSPPKEKKKKKENDMK